MSNRTGSAENDNTMDHECNICWEKFELKQHLESHKIRFHNPKISKMIDEVHQGLKLFSCNSCDKSYGNFMELNNHFKMVHKGGKKSQNKLEIEFMKYKTAIKDNQNLKEIKISQQDNVETENKPEETQFIKKNIVGKYVNNKKVKEVSVLKDYLKCPQCSFCANNRVVIEIHFKNFHQENVSEKNNINKSHDINRFECDVCGNFCENNDLIQRHINDLHKGKRNTRCEFCEKLCFCENVDLKRHMDKNHKSILLKCIVCQIYFENKQELNEHMIEFHPPESQSVVCISDKDGWIYQCEKCHEGFKKFTTFKFHKSIACSTPKVHRIEHDESLNVEQSQNDVNKITNQEPHLHKCDSCSKSFHSPYELKIHCNQESMKLDCNSFHEGHKDLKIAFSEKSSTEAGESLKKFNCDKCQKLFNNKWSLKKHKISEGYKLNEKNKCDQCGFTVCNRFSLERHVKKIHGKSKSSLKKLDCENCGKSFSLTGDLKRNTRRIHEGRKDVTCNSCGKRFDQIHNFERHKQSSNCASSLKKCDFCDKLFSEAGKLKKHFHNRHKDLKCVSCGKSFSTAGHLKRHIHTIHEGHKDYKCESCSKSFT